MDSIFPICEHIHENGNNFWSVFGGPLATLMGVLISGIFAVILFNRSIKKERKLFKEKRDQEIEDEKNKIRKEQDFFKDYFLTLLNAIIENSRIQNDEYLEYAKQLKENPRQQFYPKQRTHENLTRVLRIDTNKLMEIFHISNLKKEDFTKLLSNLDYLNEIFKQILEDIYERNGKTVIELSNKLIQIRNQILDTATDFIYQHKIENPKDYMNFPIWNVINDLVNNYHSENDGMPSVQWGL